MGLLKVLLLALLPLFIVGNLPRFQIREGVFVNPLDVGIFFLLPFAVFYLLQYPEKVKDNPLAKYILILLGTLLFSLLVNIFFLQTEDILIASLYFFRVFAYTQLIFIFSLFGKKFSEKFLKFLGWTIAVTAVIGLIQYFLYNNLRNLEYLGWDVHQYRVFSSFLDPNFSGIIFILGLYILLTLWKSYSKNEKKAAAVLMVVEFISLLLTYSRTAYITLFITGIIFISNKFRKIYLLFFIVVVTLLIFLIPKNLQSEGVKIFRTTSIYARAEEYKQGFEVFINHPIFGVGFNAYRAYNIRDLSNFPENAASGIPNSYILTLATAGLVGFTALLYFICGIYKFTKRIKSKNLKTLVCMVSLTVGISALFENTIYYNYILFIFLTVLGVVSALNQSKESKQL